MKINNKITMFFLCFCLPQFGFARITTNANDPAVRSKCADGTYSTSVGRGTCSHHGGVVDDDLPIYRIPELPKIEQPKNYPNTVTCADGTSARSGKGACSKHGGVAHNNSPAYGGVVYSNLPTYRTLNTQPKIKRSKDYSNTVTCTDGTSSRARKGACSRHGGIAHNHLPAYGGVVYSNLPTYRTLNTQPKIKRSKNYSNTVTCTDGTLSRARKGACSRHGGVTYNSLPTYDGITYNNLPAYKTSNTQPKIEQPKNYPNTVTCADGTSSRARKGACSRHGGVVYNSLSTYKALNTQPKIKRSKHYRKSTKCTNRTSSRARKKACSGHSIRLRLAG